MATVNQPSASSSNPTNRGGDIATIAPAFDVADAADDGDVVPVLLVAAVIDVAL